MPSRCASPHAHVDSTSRLAVYGDASGLKNRSNPCRCCISNRADLVVLISSQPQLPTMKKQIASDPDPESITHTQSQVGEGFVSKPIQDDAVFGEICEGDTNYRDVSFRLTLHTIRMS